jgi:hypothetical protein
MKKFIDNKLTSLTDRHFNRTAKKEKETVRIASNSPTIYEVIQAVKEEGQNRANDKGINYFLSQLHFFGRKNGYTAPAESFITVIKSTCSKMFPYSRVATILTTGLEKLSLKLDTKFLDKVAETVSTQEEFDGTINKLGFTDNSLKSIESRKYLTSKVNILKGADTVNNLMYELVEVPSEPVKTSASILENDSLLNAYKTPTNNYEDFQLEKEAEFLQIIDFEMFPVSYESFDVRTAQYQLLDTLPETDWVNYLEKMNKAGINVEYNKDTDTFDVLAFDINAEDPRDTKKLEYEHFPAKAPGGIKFKKEPPPEGKKKEVEIVTKLEGQAREAFTKIFKRTEQLRKLKDKQVEIQANLTAIKNSYVEEKQVVATELEGYLQFAESSFKKLGLFDEMAYALETNEGMILAAIKTTGKIVVPEDPTKQIIPADATNILDRLKKMGKITGELVAEVEKQINDENSLVKTTEHITKTLYTWQPTEKDLSKVRGEIKQAGPLDKFLSFLKNAVSGIKKFFGFVDAKTDEFSENYQELQEILEKY